MNQNFKVVKQIVKSYLIIAYYFSTFQQHINTMINNYISKKHIKIKKNS